MGSASSKKCWILDIFLIFPFFHSMVTDIWQNKCQNKNNGCVLWAFFLLNACIFVFVWCLTNLVHSFRGEYLKRENLPFYAALIHILEPHFGKEMHHAMRFSCGRVLYFMFPMNWLLVPYLCTWPKMRAATVKVKVTYKDTIQYIWMINMQ